MTRSRSLRPKLSRLDAEQLAPFCEDPHRESTLPIKDYVVCRECGARFRQCLNEMHFQQHRPEHVHTIAEYRAKWRDAPLCSANWQKEKNRLQQQARMRKSGGVRKKRKPHSRLSEAELALFRADPHRESTLPIKDYVVCRECGARRRQSLDTKHFQKNCARPGELTVADYRKRHPDAPLYAVNYRKKLNKKQNEKARQRKKEDPEYAAKIQARAQEKKAKKEQGRERIRAKWHAPRRATDAENDAFRKGPTRCDYVVCQVPGCLAKRRDIATNHLAKVHGISPEEYRQRYPGYPTKALGATAKRVKAGRPRKDVQRQEIDSLKKAGRSWGQIRVILNQKHQQSLTADAYRSLHRS